MRNLVFFYPIINKDGLKQTFNTYLKYFKKKYNIVLVTNSPALKKFKSKYANIKIYNLNNSFLSKIKFLNEVFCLLKIFKFFNKQSIIFSLDKHFYLLILKFLNFQFKLIIRIPNPILFQSNLKENYFSDNAGNKFGILDIKFLKYSNKIIVYSKKNMLLLKKKYNLKNLVLIRNYFKKNICNKKRVKKDYNLFFIGRLVDSKDPVFFLVNTLKLVKKLNFKIHIIGDGPKRKELLNILNKSSNKNKVFIHGFVKSPFKKFNKKIDLFCLTSKFDGTPNVLGEAVSYKIPCLAPKGVGSVDEILNHGKYGCLYKPNNEKSFCENLTRALRNYNLSVKKADMAYKNLDLYSKHNTLDKLNNVLKKVN